MPQALQLLEVGQDPAMTEENKARSYEQKPNYEHLKLAPATN